MIVMMIMSVDLPVNSFPLRLKRDSRQTGVFGFTLVFVNMERISASANGGPRSQVCARI